MRPAPPKKTRQLWLYILLIVAAVGAMLSLRTCGGHGIPIEGRPEAGGSGGDTIDVGLVYGPMSYYMYGDTLGGYNYDLLRLIERREGVHFKFWPVNSLEDALARLRSGRFKLLLSLPEDAGFKDELRYSEPLFLDRQVLVRRAGGTPISVLDLGGKTLHIEKGSPIAGRIRNLCREIGDTIYLEEHPDLSSELLVLKVQSGEMDYAVVNERIAAPLTRKFPDIDISSPISFNQFQCAVTATADSALLTRFNDWVTAAASTPEGQSLARRYSPK